MLDRILIPIDRILDLAPDVETASIIHQELCTLADALNEHVDYNVELTHIDTRNFLAFSIGTVDPGDRVDRVDEDLEHLTPRGLLQRGT